MFGEFYFGQPYFADGPGATGSAPVVQALAVTVQAKPGAAPVVPFPSTVVQGIKPGTAPYYVPFTIYGSTPAQPVAPSAIWSPKSPPTPFAVTIAGTTGPYIVNRSYQVPGIPAATIVVVQPWVPILTGTTPPFVVGRSYQLPGITIGTPPTPTGTPSGLTGFVGPSELAGVTSPSQTGTAGKTGYVAPMEADALLTELGGVLLAEDAASLLLEISPAATVGQTSPSQTSGQTSPSETTGRG